ncbi:S8 family serine peptidase [Streptomyces sp. MI02-7b]|uniref:S8 family serine peptidase n=1 Tax=Streptomyces sp. MI02-7b TaxID=462941 RepID=UPI0029B2033A|nr:S8 family serine peptidase [Streptomyces sp. MI02-7b]MDX3078389.1 S8 family serine peptidase [Streptomyces sp. MI02-7b]
MRLITGDRVTVSDAPNGKRVASVQRAPGREKVFFQITERDGALTVLPSDAAALVRTERLDAGLFDVTALIAQGYDEAHSDALPLIVSPPEGTARAASERVDGLLRFHEATSEPLRLSSIDAQSLRVADRDLAAFWKQLAPPGHSSIAATAATPKIWVDHKVRPTLDRSTGQINAPAAWAAGYVGKGVRVAVLDTGADQTHPDLAGRVFEAKDFSGSGSTEDHFGHGTHVAATVGGSGNASNGLRKGVAPSADLLIGKVLGDDGSGSESQVIEGMEWAAAQGARVVNMSLGADMETDGTDPMSQAVNEISRSSGALFVVAAGNSGEQGATTIGTPGAADAALTVGAVDRDDSLASFSSRGPRYGDRAVKPDITAPGVGIVAARAAGTSMGMPIDQYYTAADGTSMATPHVTGAAALLAGQHPEWGAEQLKDALVSTSHTVPGQVPTEQGGGRVDVKAAMFGPVTATGSITLGNYGLDGSPVERAGVIRYTNHSRSEVSLSLHAELATLAGGKKLPAQALKLGANTIRIAPGASVEVPIGLDPSKAGRGNYYGYVTATSSSGEPVHTTLSLSLHAPVHKITMDSYGPAGDPIYWDFLQVFGGDADVQFSDSDPSVAEVEEGTYQIGATAVEWTSTGARVRQILQPEVKVTADTTVRLDARTAKLMRVHTPNPAVRRNDLSYEMYRKIDGTVLDQTIAFDGGAETMELYVSPTRKVTEGEFEFNSRWEMTAPQLITKVRDADFDLTPYYLPASVPFDAEGERLTAVDAGTKQQPDLRPSTVRGKIAVIRDDTAGNGYDLAEVAAKAGAKGIMIVLPEGFQAWTQWEPTAPRSAVPVIRVDGAQGAALLQHMKRHKAVIDISGTVKSPYLYDIKAIWPQQIPQDATYTVSDRNTARVKASYADNGALAWDGEQRFSWRPYADVAWETSRPAPTGGTRTEYVTSGDTQWQHYVNFMTPVYWELPMVSGLRDTPRTFKAGEKTHEEWYKAVVRPSIPRGWNRPSARDGDVLRLAIPEYTDSEASHWARQDTAIPWSLRTSAEPGATAQATYQGDKVTSVLYRDGRKVSEADNAWGNFVVPAGEARYRLDLTTERLSQDWETGTRTSTSWTFRSGTTTAETLLPLLQVDYAVPADLRNTVGGGKRHDIDLTVRNQDGLATPTGVKLSVEASFDDGTSWTGRVHVENRGHNGFTATIERPDGKPHEAYVTLRVTASDKAGNTVQQTVERAYRLSK